MLSIIIEIADINYEKSCQQFFPFLKEKAGEMKSLNMGIHFLQKLDDVAFSALLEFIKRLPENTKNDVIILMINLYSLKITDKLNQEVQKISYGQYLKIGDVSAVQKNGKIYLWINKISVDYKGLINELPIRILRKPISFFAESGENLEKVVVSILWTKKHKKKIMELAKNTLNEYGLVMELLDIEVIKERSKDSVVIVDKTDLKLSERTEIDILDVLVGYLTDIALKMGTEV